MSSATQKKIIVFSSFAGCMCRVEVALFVLAFRKQAETTAQKSRDALSKRFISNNNQCEHPDVNLPIYRCPTYVFTKHRLNFFFKTLTVYVLTRGAEGFVYKHFKQAGGGVWEMGFFDDTRYHRMSRSTPFVQLDLSLKNYSNDNCVPLRLIQFRFIKLTVTSCCIYSYFTSFESADF